MSEFRKKVGSAVLAKNLGRRIGSVKPTNVVSDIDGDSDGFVTGPDGRDNIPAPVARVTDALKEAWSERRKKALEIDEQRAIALAQKAKQRKPTRTPQEMRELLINAKTAEDARDVRKMTREWAKSIFEMSSIGDNGEYRVKLFSGDTGVSIRGRRGQVRAAHEDEPHLYVAVSGEIIDKDGKQVGMFERYIYLDDENPLKKPHVYNNFLRIKNEYKGQGIGADFTIGSEAAYSQMGIEKMSLNAGLADGAYTWLRAGYRFKDDKNREEFVKELESRYKKMLADAGGSKEALVAGGFSTRVGRHWQDDKDEDQMPSPLFSSMEELDLFLKFMSRMKSAPVGSSNEIPPSSVTMFGHFSRRLMRAMNVDLIKDVPQRQSGEKSLVFIGIDKFLNKR